MNKKTVYILICISFLSFFFTVINFRVSSPPCFNSDEAAFAYNAYSILKTGKDEYGTTLPLRLKSFGDFKMPLYSYLSVPFIAVFGLNEWGARSLNVFLSLLFPLVVFLLAQELFQKKSVSLLAAFLSASSLGLHIVVRHAHEAYLAAFLTTITLFFLIKLLKEKSMKSSILFALSTFFMLFSYHPGRLFAALFLGIIILNSLQVKNVKKNIPIFLILSIVVLLFSFSDLLYKPERLKNLLFFSSQGIQLKVQELKTEGGIRYLYNPLIIGLRDITFEHLSYFSPQFLLQNGDSNDRFGYKGMGLITPIEYIFFFIGIYYLFKRKELWRYILVCIVFFSPLSASLSWATASLTRSLFLLIPISILAAYGAIHFYQSIKENKRVYTYIMVCLLLFLFFLTTQWDFYLFHYPKRLITIHAWQCGYKEVGNYLKQNYNKFNRFYITKDIGMPYIFTLFYLQYPPHLYQKQAQLTPPDQYGFGQVERFDKFIFHYENLSNIKPKTAVIGTRENMNDQTNKSIVKTIAPQGEPMFLILEKK